MVSSNQPFIRGPNDGSSFPIPFTDSKGVICLGPVVAEQDANLQQSVT